MALTFFKVILLSVLSFQHTTSENVPSETGSGEFAPTVNSLLLVSTLDGTLHAIDKLSGTVKWKLDESPVLDVPMESATIKRPTFLPDPHDGSLYAFEPASTELSKLPFTIQELVQASPCRSSDGILYTGKKQDYWYSINPANGIKHHVFTTDNADKCPSSTGEKMFIGRTEYKVAMFDSKLNIMRWNVTFTDYSAHASEKVMEDYELMHLASSADGSMITVDKQTGQILWVQNYGFPVVAVYQWQPEGLQKVEMTSVASQTLTHFLQQTDGRAAYWESIFQKEGFTPKQNSLMSSLYVGQYQQSLYALQTMTHDSVPINIPSPHSTKMLPGPGVSSNDNSDVDFPIAPSQSCYPVWKLLGYHKNPPISRITLPRHTSIVKPPLLIRQETPPKEKVMATAPSDEDYHQVTINVDIDYDDYSPNTSGDNRQLEKQSSVKINVDKKRNKYQDYDDSDDDDLDIDERDRNTQQIRWNEITVVATLTSIFTGTLFLIFTKSQSRIRRNTSSRQQHSNSTLYDGMKHVGRISYNPHDLIGKGSEGTLVYKGVFDGRQVAVKRVVPECFSFADREVQLLRESDEHHHVVRYFCTERDPQFQYIALELCSNTLQEYVENPQYQCSTGIDTVDVLHQAMMGLDHLHQLKIVHRDVKPTNILISFPGNLGKQRVVISDFGLCKKLVPGRLSFSHRSGGCAGTDGWIAPEMILDKKYRMTQAVDIFSMGCVFYYVICGKHPFGDSFTRQARIVKGEYSLEELQKFEYCEEASDIIRRMLMINPSERPKSSLILHHPLFWSSAKTLQFYEDVSDRLEKEDDYCQLMMQLESPVEWTQVGPLFENNDWTAVLCTALHNDLQKFRSYHGHNIKDLLRAIRNKRHHYRELPDEVKLSLGTLPDEYLKYFSQRFPKLLMHIYIAMSTCALEDQIKVYYGESIKDYSYCKSDVVLDPSVFAKKAAKLKNEMKRTQKFKEKKNPKDIIKEPDLIKDHSKSSRKVIPR